LNLLTKARWSLRSDPFFWSMIESGTGDTTASPFEPDCA